MARARIDIIIKNCAIALRADAQSVSDFIALAERVKQEFGELDILFVNAGVAQRAEFREVTEEGFDREIGINVKGV